MGGVRIRQVGGKLFVRPIENPGKEKRRAANKSARAARRRNR